MIFLNKIHKIINKQNYANLFNKNSVYVLYSLKNSNGFTNIQKLRKLALYIFKSS
jgi:hypothetical protein